MKKRLLRCIGWASLIPLVFTASLWAQAATAPATQPASDETAVRAILKSLSKSLQDGNVDGIRQVLYAGNPTEQKMVDAMGGMAARIAQLFTTAAKVYGNDEAKQLTGDLAEELGRIDEAQIEFAGDTATVRYKTVTPTTAPAAKPDEPANDADAEQETPLPPLIVKRIEGQWRVPVSELSKDTPAEEIEQRLADLDIQTKVIAELTDEIGHGKYKSAEKAADAWQAKMMQALSPKKPGDEKPASEKKAEEKK